MDHKTISETILDKFEEFVNEDKSFDDINEELCSLIKKDKFNKKEIEELFKRLKNEDS